jgi:hypothetical protein
MTNNKLQIYSIQVWYSKNYIRRSSQWGTPLCEKRPSHIEDSFLASPSAIGFQANILKAHPKALQCFNNHQTNLHTLFENQKKQPAIPIPWQSSPMKLFGWVAFLHAGSIAGWPDQDETSVWEP